MSNDMLDWLYQRALMRRKASLSVYSINSMSLMQLQVTACLSFVTFVIPVSHNQRFNGNNKQCLL